MELEGDAAGAATGVKHRLRSVRVDQVGLAVHVATLGRQFLEAAVVVRAPLSGPGQPSVGAHQLVPISPATPATATRASRDGGPDARPAGPEPVRPDCPG